MVKVLPWFSSLSTVISPPCIRTTSRASDRPRPEPISACTRGSSLRKNLSNTLGKLVARRCRRPCPAPTIRRRSFVGLHLERHAAALRACTWRHCPAVDHDGDDLVFVEVQLGHLGRQLHVWKSIDFFCICGSTLASTSANSRSVSTFWRSTVRAPDFHAADAQQVVDESGQPRHLAVDDVAELLLQLDVDVVARGQRLGVGLDVGQRRAELVRGRVDEPVARLLGKLLLRDVAQRPHVTAGSTRRPAAGGRRAARARDSSDLLDELAHGRATSRRGRRQLLARRPPWRAAAGVLRAMCR